MKISNINSIFYFLIVQVRQEGANFSVMNSNVNESSLLNPHELVKRNFYLQLFRAYNELPLDELLESFSQIYNDVFMKEKPLTIQKYFLCEIAIAELTQSNSDLSLIYNFNFAHVIFVL